MTQYQFTRSNKLEQSLPANPMFNKHKKEWFLNRVGESVRREFTLSTPTSVKKTPLTEVIVICSEKHAEACYHYHMDNKINFAEIQIKTK